jgi:hypothetical protein
MRGVYFQTVAGLSLGVAAIFGASPGSAQIWIGQIAGEMAANASEARCLNGQLQSPAKIAEAQAFAASVMQDYWRAASAADVTDVSIAFHPTGEAEWVNAGEVRKARALAAIHDPFARAGVSDPPTLIGFVRSGDGFTTRGLWRVGSAENPTGYYLVGFRRLVYVWKAAHIELLPAATEVAQYCHKPGDVEIYKADVAKQEAERAARRAAREAARAAGN